MTIKQITPAMYTPEQKAMNCRACTLALVMRDCPRCLFNTPAKSDKSHPEIITNVTTQATPARVESDQI